MHCGAAQQPTTRHPGPCLQDAASWPALRNIQLCWAYQFLWATHLCSYACALSRYAPTPAADASQCWLAAQPGGAPGSQCGLWPTDYPGMMA